ncbi:peptidoglycan DD-metalloendopeptidase family protein [Mucilaginibacter sp. Bleaf8]|uniref:peptidoglycan DD-metalloendopeptidase family protein n=1 Tax=Mucilaginibacter sp. Bleaf8 TaxID=2834430 RepID=UPI001BD096D0|nr:peptidoglycan DD-metalloendopeptidase family protein [Mucilaginibacter sp. Bleaf8]MBS7565846.1 peptidoglycan DD-metalloendopeptidase family protein [Mucilaginibacter sp. Bleaf8]
MDKHQQLAAYLNEHPEAVGKVVDFNAEFDCLLPFDFTAANTELSADTIADTAAFSLWVDERLKQSDCRYGIGGYMEHRTLYARSALFNTADQEPRRLHLGADIWGPAGTPVYAPLNGRVHSFQNNNNHGDYGPTIILEHTLNGLTLYSLYGHLNAACLESLQVGMLVQKDQQIAVLGTAAENGSWPPHLHFQLMFDMEGKAGDYPGVGQYSLQEAYRQNIPDPDLILQFSKTL